MKVAITGSHSIKADTLEKYISDNITEIVSCGTSEVDICVRNCANKLNIKYSEFLLKNNLYECNTVIAINQRIAEYSDFAIVFWDGKSDNIKHLIDCFKSLNKIVYIIRRKKH